MRRYASAVVICLFIAQSAGAVARDWTGAVDNKWATAGNWNPAGVPATGDSLIFPLSGSTVRNTQNDLAPSVILANVTLGDNDTVAGNTVRISGGSNGSCQSTFTAPVQAEGDLSVGAISFAQLDPNGHVVTVQCGEFGQLIGNGTLRLAGLALSNSQPFSGTVIDGLHVGSASFLQIKSSLSMPNATFLIGAGLFGSGTIGPLTASGWVQPSTNLSIVGAISTRDLRLTVYNGLPEETGEYEVDLTAAGNDVLQVTGSVTLEDKPLRVNLNYTPANGTAFVIVDNDGADPVTGIFTMRPNPTANFPTPLPEGATFVAGGQHFQISYVGGTGNDVVLTAVPAIAPTSVSASASAIANAVTVSASVTPSGATGTVTVREGATVLGSAPVSSGNATVQFALPAGAHTLIVEYSGDASFAPASTTANVTVATPFLSMMGSGAANEDAGQVEVTVSLNTPAPNAISVDYATTDGTAIAGEDYSAAAGTILFAPGEMMHTIVVALHPDSDVEDDETFGLTLSNAIGANIMDANATLTILNDDQSFLLLRDLQYGVGRTVTGIDTPLLLDLRLPQNGPQDSNAPFPLVVVIDAARWSTPNHHSTIADFLPAHGYAVATIGFRPAPDGQFPAQLDDLKMAIAWLRSNAAAHRLNPKKMAVIGNGHAGGHLAALAAVTENVSLGIDAAIVGRPATDLVALDATGCDGKADVAALLGCAPSACVDTARSASPLTHASRGDAPFLIFQTPIDCGQSQPLADALMAAHVEANVAMAAASGAAIDWSSAMVRQRVVQFLDAKVNEQGSGRTRAVRK
jgi:hypothetical protein